MGDCSARYHLNRAVNCWKEGPHKTHEGLYLLAGSTVTWTDEDKPPEKVQPRSQKTAIQEAFERAGYKEN